jgi:hypothetical protein
MDKKLTFAGGEPNINFDDILRDPIANRDALFGLMLGLGVTTDCIISGAVVFADPGVSGEVTDGYVWLNGEILQVDADSTLETEGTDLWEFQKVVTYDSNGDKTFNDLTPRQTWQKNRAILVNVSAITGFDAVNAPSLLATVVNNQKASAAETKTGTIDNKITTPKSVRDGLFVDSGWLNLINLNPGGEFSNITAKVRQIGHNVVFFATFDVPVSGGDLTSSYALGDLPVGITAPSQTIRGAASTDKDTKSANAFIGSNGTVSIRLEKLAAESLQSVYTNIPYLVDV